MLRIRTAAYSLGVLATMAMATGAGFKNTCSWLEWLF